MRKISKWLSAAAVTMLAVIMSAVTAFAADDDICLFEGECRSPRSWGQAFAYNFNGEESIPFSLSDMNENTKLYVEFVLESEPPEEYVGLEFILYRRKTEDVESIWARVAPADIKDGVAVFDYPSMIEAVGHDDLSDIDSIYVGDTDNELLVKKVTFDIDGDGIGDAPAEEEKSDDKDKSEQTAAADSEEESESGGINVVLIVVIAVVVIAAVVVVLVLKNRKRYY
ncbi:MAG: hypothetical protein J5999_11805 [Oscillospiraceae bacterium]|nr:hypothetical protein [Oscillospiraceae bacterium]